VCCLSVSLLGQCHSHGAKVHLLGYVHLSHCLKTVNEP
jgi:hypothetical protein